MMSTLEVSERSLAANVRTVEGVLAASTGDGLRPALLAVVKADAYGHSATVCAPMLARAGVPWLGVTDAEEGAAVRRSIGAGGPRILVMSGPPGTEAAAREAADVAVRERLTPVVWSETQIRMLADAVRTEPLDVHIEVDTGMSRQGARIGAGLEQLLTAIAREPRVRLDGVMTHLASAERAAGRQTRAQLAAFSHAVNTVAAAGLRPTWVHVGNAATIDNGAVDVVERLCGLASSIDARAMVRCGLGLYGVCLPMEGQGVSRLRGMLRPVLTWRTAVISVMELAGGDSIGYGASFTARRPMHVALLPIGYADGLRRSLSGTDRGSGGWVMVGARRAAIVGRVSMNLTTVDVTDFEPPVNVGDDVVLLGDGITVQDHARLAGALEYEILCGLRGRHVRV